MAEKETKKTTTVSKPQKGNAGGLRAGAIILWLLAIGCEVVAILTLKGTLYFGDNMLYWLIGALVVDLILVVIGSQLWKNANDRAPVSKSNKVKFFLWNQMGVIVAVIAFVPIIILLLRDKSLDGKLKKIVTAVAVVALLVAGLLSYDFDPPSVEDYEAAETRAESIEDYTGVAYWTVYGHSYHFSKDCQTLQNSSTIYEGTLEEAIDAHREDPCDFCAGGGSK